VFLAARIGLLSEDSTLVPENRPLKCFASNEGEYQNGANQFFSRRGHWCNNRLLPLLLVGNWQDRVIMDYMLSIYFFISEFLLPKKKGLGAQSDFKFEFFKKSGKSYPNFRVCPMAL